MTTTDSTSAPSQTSSQPAVPDKAAAAQAPAAPVSAAAAPATTTPAPVTPEPKPAEAKPAEPAKPAEAAKPVEVKPAESAPEYYELAPPKGVTFDPDFVTAIAPAFKDAKIPKAAGEKLVSTFLEFQKALPARMLARDLEATMKDPVLGQLNWGKTQGMVNEALAAFTTPEFRQKLERWGIANDLEFVRVFAEVGKAMRGDVAARGSPTTAGEESMADRMYRKAVKPNVQ